MFWTFSIKKNWKKNIGFKDGNTPKIAHYDFPPFQLRFLDQICLLHFATMLWVFFFLKNSLEFLIIDWLIFFWCTEYLTRTPLWVLTKRTQIHMSDWWIWFKGMQTTETIIKSFLDHLGDCLQTFTYVDLKYFVIMWFLEFGVINVGVLFQCI